jgi:hypothetical protein
VIEAQKYKFSRLLAPISLAGGASATSIIVDTLGFSYADVVVFFGDINASGVTVLKIQEDDAVGGGSATDIPGATFADALPVNADDNGAFSVKFPLGAGRKRYLKLVLTNAATNITLASAFVLLHRADEVPNTIAERGLADEIILS